jgi:hypothetical protein
MKFKNGDTIVIKHSFFYSGELFEKGEKGKIVITNLLHYGIDWGKYAVKRRFGHGLSGFLKAETGWWINIRIIEKSCGLGYADLQLSLDFN